MNLERIAESTRFLKGKGVTTPQIGIVLGTGLGNLVKEIKVELEIPYEQIPNFPLSTVESHSGKLLYGVLGGKQILAMQGRFHAYEGYSMEEIVFPVRVLKQLGIEVLLISNAAGAMNLEFKKGDLMLITDHINSIIKIIENLPQQQQTPSMHHQVQVLKQKLNIILSFYNKKEPAKTKDQSHPFFQLASMNQFNQ